MTMANRISIEDFKSQARRLRRAMAEQGAELAHSAALELVAKSHGQRDWNTLAALTKQDAAHTLSISLDQKVRGTYLGQAFEGTVIGLSRMTTGDLYRVTVKFDRPVDVVTFESFSALRHRADAVIDIRGISPRKTSNGLPQMTVEAIA